MKRTLFILSALLLIAGLVFSASKIDGANDNSSGLVDKSDSVNLFDKNSEITPPALIWSDDAPAGGDWSKNQVQDFMMSDSPGEDYDNNVDIFVYTTDPLDFSGSDITAPDWTFYLTGEQFLTYDYMETGYATSAPSSWGDFTVLNQYSATYSNQSFTEDLSSLASESTVYLGFYQHTSSVVVYPGYDINLTYVYDDDSDPLILGDHFNSGQTYELTTHFWTRVNEGTEPPYDWWGPYWDGSTYYTAWRQSYWETPDDEGGYNHYHNAEPGAVDSIHGCYTYDEGYCDNGDWVGMWLTTSIDLSGYENCELSWWQRGETESSYDEIEVDISTDGSTWNNIYSDYIDTGPWEEASVDISAYDDESTVYLRYKINNDFSVCYDGWYVDDIEINGDGVSIDNTSLGNIKSMFE